MNEDGESLVLDEEEDAGALDGPGKKFKSPNLSQELKDNLTESQKRTREEKLAVDETEAKKGRND